jgi:hypothetical protein
MKARCRGHGLLERDGSRYAYQLTTKGVQVAPLFLFFPNASGVLRPTAAFTTPPTQLTHPTGNLKPPITKLTKRFRTSSTYSLPRDVTPMLQASNVEVFLLKIFDPRIYETPAN